MRRNISDKTKQTAIAAFRGGMSLRDAGEKFGVHPRSISKWAKAAPQVLIAVKRRESAEGGGKLPLKQVTSPGLRAIQQAITTLSDAGLI